MADLTPEERRIVLAHERNSNTFAARVGALFGILFVLSMIIGMMLIVVGGAVLIWRAVL